MLIAAVLVGGCAGKRSSSTSAAESIAYLASVYNPSQLSLHPEYIVYHESDINSVLYIRAYPRELRFNKTNEESEYRAMLNVEYQLIQLEEPGLEGVVVDSAAVTYKLLKRDENRSAFFASLKIPLGSGHRYLLRVQARDLNRGSVGLEYLYVDKTNACNAQNFKLVSSYSGYPKFMRFFLPGEQFNITHRDQQIDTLQVDYFSFKNELPRPPVNASMDYTMNYSPDTTYKIATTDTSHYVLQTRGRFHVRMDASREEGLTLFNFGGSFPQVKNPDELLEPLFYLATLAEYRDLRTNDNRVVYSNLYFTSNKEGWKTDQGMIFILFGPPGRIQMTGKGERWYYFAKRRSMPIEFRFNRKTDVLLDQSLEWVQTTESKMLWNDAVSSWRKGRVYSTGN